MELYLYIISFVLSLLANHFHSRRLVSNIFIFLSLIALTFFPLQNSEGPLRIWAISLLGIVTLEFFLKKIGSPLERKVFIRGLQYYCLTFIFGDLFYMLLKGSITTDNSKFLNNLYLESIVLLLILDFKSYLIHYLKHKLDFWWRFHIVHHAQGSLYSISAAQAHLIDWLFSTHFLNLVIMTSLGFSAESYILYGCLLIFSTVFAHTPLAVPSWLSWISFIVVTPEYHRTHHSSGDEKFKNYGDILVLWDYLFGTNEKEKNKDYKIGLENSTLENKSIFYQQIYPFIKHRD